MPNMADQNPILAKLNRDLAELLANTPKPIDPMEAADEYVKRDIEAEQVNLRG